MKFIVTGILIALVSQTALSAAWMNGNKVQEVAIKYGNGCVTLTNGEVVKLDLTTDVGKAEFSLALAAKTSGKELDVYQNDQAFVGGCDSGDTVKPHSMLRVDN
ncbi:MAG: hypothetical protein OQK78_10345 [Gammaproteobacteria bacterium]|nr:hypothetical protein [Gammaproteobacteria bacterium]